MTEPLVSDLHHVSINVDDYAAAEAFYVDTLGLAKRDDRPDFGFGGAWLQIGGRQIHLIETQTPEDLGQHFAFEVADLDATIAELRQRGVEVTDAVAVGSGRQAFAHDPCGNRLEFNQPGATL
ncbi:MAG: lactoylglutathione lyase [Acidimicrobiales bacterium]|nr:lactoylglutathione lyase [Acidimicrobiales bacterium]